MSNTDIKKIIMKEYMIDVDAVRNLSKLANDLTLNNKLVVPGGLEIIGNLKVNGEVDLKKNLKTAGNLDVVGNATIGPAYIGKYGKTRSDYAQFSHKNNTTTKNYALIHHSNGKLWLNSSKNQDINISHNDSVKSTFNKSGQLNVNGKIRGGSLEIRGNSDFGTASGRKVQITSSNYGNEQTYIGFYNGNSRTNYLLPNKSNNELRVQHKLRTGSHLSCGGNVSGRYIYGSVPGYLKKGSNFKFSAVSGGYGGVVWSNSIKGNGRERGLAARRSSGGDQFRITYISR